jgi:hypothetical protein
LTDTPHGIAVRGFLLRPCPKIGRCPRASVADRYRVPHAPCPKFSGCPWASAIHRCPNIADAHGHLQSIGARCPNIADAHGHRSILHAPCPMPVASTFPHLDRQESGSAGLASPGVCAKRPSIGISPFSEVACDLTKQAKSWSNKWTLPGSKSLPHFHPFTIGGFAMTDIERAVRRWLNTDRDQRGPIPTRNQATIRRCTLTLRRLIQADRRRRQQGTRSADYRLTRYSDECRCEHCGSKICVGDWVFLDRAGSQCCSADCAQQTGGESR